MSEFIKFKPCNNPLCDHQTSAGAAYCCNSCSLAHEKGYEIHEDGILGHAPSCLERHAERGPAQSMRDAS